MPFQFMLWPGRMLPGGVGLAAKLPLLFLFIISATTGSVRAKIHYQKWEVAYQFKTPDCFQKLAITINGRTSGPTIIAEQGDTVVIDVKNALLTENLAIHWHGIRQIGTPWFDGAEGVTQCPVVPRDTFTYRFVVDRPGTYMYHAHYEMQRSAGLYGLIRVLPPTVVVEPFIYDYDRSIIPNDWWHESTHEQEAGLNSKNFTWVGEPQSFFINGREKFDYSKAGSRVCDATNPECSPYVLTVIPGRTYRLQIASITSFSDLNFEIEGHNLNVVEADGHHVKPFIVNNLNIYSGSDNFNNSVDESLILKRKSEDVLPYLNGRCIYLVGMMGSGKTTVGKILSEVLGYSFFDSDKLVEQAVGISSVAQIFKEHSEAFFRDNESKVLRDLSSMHHLVVATGGGAVDQPINWKYMKKGITIWLDIPLDVLARRIAAVGTDSRPLLHQGSGDPYKKAFVKLTALAEQRDKAYANADARVSLEHMAARQGYGVSEFTPTAVAIEALMKIECFLIENAAVSNSSHLQG